MKFSVKFDIFKSEWSINIHWGGGVTAHKFQKTVFLSLKTVFFFLADMQLNAAFQLSHH